ncbi:MAG: methyl-accepting chemotaxis protein [Gammaproteobacteria bacterium]
MKLLADRKLFSKQALTVALLLAPLAYMTMSFVSDETARVNETHSKSAGMQFLQPLEEITSGLSEHEVAAVAIASGNAAASSELRTAEQHVDEQFAGLPQVYQDAGTDFGARGVLESLHADWEALKRDGAKLSLDDSVKAHEQLLERAGDINTSNVAASHLRLTDRAEIYLMTDIVTDKILAAEREIGSVVATLTTATSTKQLTPELRFKLTALAARMQVTLGEMSSEFQTALATHENAADLRAKGGPAVDKAKQSVETFARNINDRVLGAAGVQATLEELKPSSDAALDAIDQLHDVLLPELMDHHAKRVSQMVSAIWIRVGITVVAALLAIALAYALTRMTVGPLREAVRVFDSVAAGNLDNQIDVSRRDEIGEVLSKLSQMQKTLKAQLEKERDAASANARLRQALDSVTANVMVADSDHSVIYANPAVVSMLRAAENDMRRELPGFSATAVQGSSIALFYKNPSQQLNLFAALHSAHREELTIGGRTFAIVANPIVGPAGERLGTVLEWTDRTQEITVEKELQAMLAEVIGGNLRKRLEMAGKTGFFELLGKGVNQLADNMADLVARVKNTAGEVFRGAEEISSGNANLSSRTEQQSSSLEETASSMEEMTSTVKQNADNAGQANQLATAARDQAERGGSVVGRAVKAMTEINDSSKKIADIIGVIDEIAFQTNLLALNAAVEAARAGEQGRGFAVVASEVRSLAGRSATAAKEIKDLIQDSVKKVEDGSVLVAQSGQTLEQIVSSVKKVSDIIAEIAAASREQSSGIEQVNRAIMQMDAMTQQNAALVEEASASSQAMADQARQLNETLSRYQVDTLLTTGAAAPPRRPASATPARAAAA